MKIGWRQHLRYTIKSLRIGPTARSGGINSHVPSQGHGLRFASAWDSGCRVRDDQVTATGLEANGSLGTATADADRAGAGDDAAADAGHQAAATLRPSIPERLCGCRTRAQSNCWTEVPRSRTARCRRAGGGPDRSLDQPGTEMAARPATAASPAARLRSMATSMTMLQARAPARTTITRASRPRPAPPTVRPAIRNGPAPDRAVATMATTISKLSFPPRPLWPTGCASSSRLPFPIRCSA